jgi:hypothetical protein
VTPPEDFDVVSHEMIEARHVNQASAVWWADHLTHSLGVGGVVIVPHTIDTLECGKCIRMLGDYSKKAA